MTPLAAADAKRLVRVAMRMLSVVVLALASAQAIRILFTSWFRDLDTYGFHDWDTAASYRALTVSALRHGSLPFWDSYLCGGVPAWGYSEGAPNLVSPFLPLYLLVPLPVALRLEVVGETLLALVAAYGLASVHTRSVALRGFVAVLFALNGRWALQIAVGHSWHLAYALLPLVLWGYELSLTKARAKGVVLASIALALEGYLGGIYPLPHTAFSLVAYALLRAIASKDTLPLRRAAAISLFGAGLLAPKLWPVMMTMRRFPREVPSTEAIGLSELWTMLTTRGQGVMAHPIAVPSYLWHEWGIYVGWAGVVLLALSLLAFRSGRGRALLLTGLMLGALGMGAFSPLAPWTLLHRLPPFLSQHVPSRFFFPAVLFLALAAAHSLGKLVDGVLARRVWLDLALAVAVGLLAIDLASVGARATDHAFYLHAPSFVPADEFHHVDKSFVDYRPAHAWGGPALLAREANEGLLTCSAFPNAAEPRGAIAVTDSKYRGEAYLDGASGTARILATTTNGADIEVDATSAGTLVWNMNYDAGWRADGRPAEDHAHVIATHVEAGRHTVSFRYVPVGLWSGLVVGLATVGAMVMFARGSKKRRASAFALPS